MSEPESMAALRRARAAQARQAVYALAALHAAELQRDLDGLSEAERTLLSAAYLDDLAGELAAQERLASTELLETFRAALGGHSVRAELRGIPTTEGTP